jgi:gp178
MNKDLIETPRFNFFIGDEVFLKGKIVGFDVDENKCVENVVRLEYGQTLNVPNNDIYITDDIVDKSKIKVTIPQSVADWIRKCKTFKSFAVSLSFALQPSVWEANGLSGECIEWLTDAENQDTFARAWLDGYTIEEEKKYKITLLNRNDGDLYLVNQNADLADKYGHFSPVVLLFTKGTNFSEKCYKLTKKEVVSHDFGWVFDCPGIKIEEVDD